MKLLAMKILVGIMIIDEFIFVLLIALGIL